jgi:hypothetical protein
LFRVSVFCCFWAEAGKKKPTYGVGLTELIHIGDIDHSRGLLSWPLVVAFGVSLLARFSLSFGAPRPLGRPQLVVIRGEDSLLEVVDQRGKLGSSSNSRSRKIVVWNATPTVVKMGAYQ